jgi:hypothetical protein
LGVVAPGTVRVSAQDFAPDRTNSGSTGLLRGALVAQLVRLRVANCMITSPIDDAIDALRGSGRDAPLCDVVDALDPDERAQLSAEVRAHHEVLAEVLPPVPAQWSPRCGVRQAVALAGGGVVCRGHVDLALGAPGGNRACVCLIDVTTSVLGAHHEQICDYLALLETVRTGEQPLRVATISTADGGSIVRDVTPELLGRAVEGLLDAIPQLVVA